MGRYRILHVINWIGDRGSEKTVLNFAKSMDHMDHMFLSKAVLSSEALDSFMEVGTVVMEEQDPHPGSFNYPTLTDDFVSQYGVDLVVIYLPGDELPPYVKNLSCKKVLHVLCAKKCLFDADGFAAATVPSQYASTLNPHLDPQWVYPVVERINPQASKKQVIQKYFPQADPDQDYFLISRVGSIETVKHVEDFLRIATAFRHVENMLFLVAGMGDQNYVNRLFSQYSAPNLVYAGRISEQEKADINASSTVCLYPTEFEAFGFSLAEPMSHGCPVVTYNESACPETVGDGGIVVGFNDLPALAKQLVEVITRPALRAKLGEQARQRWHRNFTQDVYVAKMEEIYEKVLND